MQQNFFWLFLYGNIWNKTPTWNQHYFTVILEEKILHIYGNILATTWRWLNVFMWFHLPYSVNRTNEVMPTAFMNCYWLVLAVKERAERCLNDSECDPSVQTDWDVTASSVSDFFKLMSLHIYRDTPPSDSDTFIQSYSCSHRIDLAVTEQRSLQIFS